jgi:hypothetical protein
VPIGGGIGKLFRLGKLPVNTQLTAYSNVVKPRQGGADWQLRFQVQFLSRNERFLECATDRRPQRYAD